VKRQGEGGDRDRSYRSRDDDGHDDRRRDDDRGERAGPRRRDDGDGDHEKSGGTFDTNLDCFQASIKLMTTDLPDRRAPSPGSKTSKPSKAEEPMDEDGQGAEDDPVVDDEEAAMAAMLGFGGFGTTKNKKVKGNDVGAVRKEKKSEYRQYMNRQGGFNRPLSPGR
jgi:U4/U6.U5 tri-snRNP-associated protein 3